VRLVGRDHCLTTTDRTFDNGDIHDVMMSGLARQHAHGSRLLLAHRLDPAHGEQPRQTRLARTAAPRLREHRRGNNRHDLLRKECRVQRPHPTVVAFGRDERPRVIGDAGHLRLTAAPGVPSGGQGAPARARVLQPARPR
jgi:hypothetical protein